MIIPLQQEESNSTKSISWCVWCIHIHTTACACSCTPSVLMEVGLDQRWVGSSTSVLDDGLKHLISSSTCACHEWIKSQIAQPSTASTHNISTIVHATTKSFVLFCSAQDGEFTDMKCLMFWAHCKNGKIWTKHQVYNKGIFINFGYFFIIWDIDIIRKCSWFWAEWCN